MLSSAFWCYASVINPSWDRDQARHSRREADRRPLLARGDQRGALVNVTVTLLAEYPDLEAPDVH